MANMIPEAKASPTHPSRLRSFKMTPTNLPVGPPLAYPIEQTILPMKCTSPSTAAATGKYTPAMSSTTNMEGANSMKLQCTLCALLNLYHCSQVSLEEQRPLPISGYPPTVISFPVALRCYSPKLVLRYSSLKITWRVFWETAKPIARIQRARAVATMRTQPQSVVIGMENEVDVARWSMYMLRQEQQRSNNIGNYLIQQNPLNLYQKSFISLYFLPTRCHDNFLIVYYKLQMIANSLFSLAFLWAWKKSHIRLKELRAVRKKIAAAAIDSVSEALKKMQSVEQGQKVFLIIKGLLKLKVKLRGEKSIYSLLELSKIKQGRLGEHFLKKTWEDLADRAYWKQPHNPKNLQFEIQDMNLPQQKILVKGCEQANLSGALNELYKDHNVRKNSSSLIVRVAIRIYNFLVSRFPFSMILSPTQIGQELTLYGIQDGQYSLVIGQFQKDKNTKQLLCKFPHYVTKQRSYVQIKIWKQQKRLMLITFLLASLLVITGIKFIRKLYEYFKQWRMRQIASDQNDERSQNQGENCDCIVCYENVRNIIFKPCLHYAVCKTCFKMLSKTSCPYCKENIEDTIEVVKKK